MDSGCCKGGDQFKCSGCKTEDKCCDEYEVCVSCCLEPSNNASALSKVTPKSLRNGIGGTWGEDTFGYCSGICRSHSRSTSHENSYIGSRHHCFSHQGRPLQIASNTLAALGALIVTSSLGQSCQDACSGAKKSCDQAKLATLNSCDSLRSFFQCEAGCEVAGSQSSQQMVRDEGAAADISSMPHYIASTAPKAQRPAMCFASPTPQSLGCSGKDAQVIRLCACS